MGFVTPGCQRRLVAVFSVSVKETSGCRLGPPVSLGSGLGAPGRTHGVSAVVGLLAVSTVVG